MAKRVLVKDLEAEIEGLQETLHMARAVNIKLSRDLNHSNFQLNGMASERAEILESLRKSRLDCAQWSLANEEMESDIRLAGYKIDNLTTGYDSRGQVANELKDENAKLIKKNEALEAVLETIAMATAAGQMVAEL